MDNAPSDASNANSSSPDVSSADGTAVALPADIASLSYEQARDELVSVVSELEQGASTLERSLALWERGEALARRCEEWLMGARERLEAARRQAPAS
ncbi:exodeoxyribonuclease VII small subunit [Frigoribacterium sp. CFBP 13712]|nr:exodeoxyribonuclease VII small subunit [Frigoribacterium sp. CFBP 13712]